MKTARVLAAIAVALALQITLARFAIGGDTVVDLVLVVVVYAALAGSPVTGLLAGTAGGVAAFQVAAMTPGLAARRRGRRR